MIYITCKARGPFLYAWCVLQFFYIVSQVSLSVYDCVVESDTTEAD